MAEVDARDIEQLKAEVKELKSKFGPFKKDVYTRLEALEKSNVQSATDYKYIVRELDSLHGQLDGISDKLDRMREKPAKRWDAAVTAAVSSVVSVIIGAIMALVVVSGGK